MRSLPWLCPVLITWVLDLKCTCLAAGLAWQAPVEDFPSSHQCPQLWPPLGGLCAGKREGTVYKIARTEAEHDHPPKIFFKNDETSKVYCHNPSIVNKKKGGAAGHQEEEDDDEEEES